jgi:hypothetical protein
VDLYGYLDKIDSIQFEVDAENVDGGKTIWDGEPLLVHYSDKTRPQVHRDQFDDFVPGHKQYTSPFMGARAEDQILLENDEVSIRLLYMGADESDFAGNLLQITNKTDHPLYIASEGTNVNGVFFDGGGNYEIGPHMTEYSGTWMPGEQDYQECGITGIGSISIPFRISENKWLWFYGDGETTWCNVDLAEHADAAADFPSDGKVLYEEDGLKVTLLRSGLGEYMVRGKEQKIPEWFLSIENDTDQDISLDIADVTEDGEKKGNDVRKQLSYMEVSPVGAHQKRLSRIKYVKEGGKTLEFRLLIKSFTGQKIFKTTDDIITLKAAGD